MSSPRAHRRFGLARAFQDSYKLQSRYDLGLSSIVELSQAQLARTPAAIQEANAKYDHQLQRAVLSYYSGLRR